MPRLAAPPTFQSPFIAAASSLTATSTTELNQRVVVPSIVKKGHSLPPVVPSRHSSHPKLLRQEKPAPCRSRAPLPPTPYLRWNYNTNKRARTMWAHRWEARHDITYVNTPWEFRRYSKPINVEMCRLDPEAEVVTTLILYGASPEPELKLKLKKDKGSGKGGGSSSTWKAEIPWDADLRDDRYLRKLRREQAAILDQVNVTSGSGKVDSGRKGKTSAKRERQWKWHYNW